jgi:rare lipoprotein A
MHSPAHRFFANISPTFRLTFLGLALATLCSCSVGNIGTPPATATAPPPPAAVQPQAPTFAEIGMASWYGSMQQGRLTASGERFDPHAFTAAHRKLPFGTILRVTDLSTGHVVRVRVNDRGPFAPGRALDLSAAAAKALGMTKDGVTRVRIEAFAADQAPQNTVTAAAGL